MAIEVRKVEVWAGSLVDQVGDLDRVLAALAGAGANLECVIARRQADRPGGGVVFVSPVKGKKQQAAAREAGLSPAADMGTLRVEAADKAGLGHRLLGAVATAGINLRGMSAAVIGKKAVFYLGFDSLAEAEQAAKAMKRA